MKWKNVAKHSISAVISVLLLCASGAHAQAAGRSYFNMSERFSSDVSNFPKWEGMVSRFNEAQNIPDSECDQRPYFPCSISRWRDLIGKKQGKPLSALLNSVNDYGNSHRYTLDRVNWGKDDYWETPFEFMAVNGDCEDYAIAKYYTLRAMGVSADQMRIIILQDLNLGGVIHAILGVYGNGGKLYLLDNQIKQVVDASRVYHYKPIYGINEDGWWAYTPQ